MARKAKFWAVLAIIPVGLWWWAKNKEKLPAQTEKQAQSDGFWQLPTWNTLFPNTADAPTAENVYQIPLREPVAVIWRTPARGLPYEKYFQAATEREKLPPGLLSRVAYQESRYDPDAFNGVSGAEGMMQIVPRWHPTMAGGKTFDPSLAIPYAAQYLRKLYNQFGTWEKALAAYNWGPGNLAEALKKTDNWLRLGVIPRETYNYVTQIAGDTGIA